MRTNDDIHIEELKSLMFPIEYKDEVIKIYQLGFKKGRAYIPRSDLIKGWVVAAISVFLIVVITYNVARYPVSTQETESATQTTLTSAEVNTIACLIQEYEGKGNKLSEYRKIIIISELLNAPQTEWGKIVKKIGDAAPTRSTSYGGKPN